MMSDNRLVGVEIDNESLASSGPEVEHERRVAIFDLIEHNVFALTANETGPYVLHLGMQDEKLVFDIRCEDNSPGHVFRFSIKPFQSIIRDYFMICQNYHEAIRHSTLNQIEAIDMARRAIHNEGSELVSLRLAGKVDVDFDTARRLFTLICALHAGQVRGQAV